MTMKYGWDCRSLAFQEATTKYGYETFLFYSASKVFLSLFPWLPLLSWTWRLGHLSGVHMGFH